jgi:flagellar assembly factor FliW
MTAISAVPSSDELHTLALRFPDGVPGFDVFERYTLLGLDDLPVYLLQCDEEPALVLPVAEARSVAADYHLELSDAQVAALGLNCSDDAAVLVVLTVSRQEDTVTANLLAPIVVNRHTGVAAQIILDGTAYQLRHPVGALAG